MYPACGNSASRLPPQSSIPLHGKGEQYDRGSAVSLAAHQGVRVNIPDIAEVADMDPTWLREFDRVTDHPVRSLLSLPIGDGERSPRGMLLLINGRNPATGAITRFGAEAQRLAEALAWQAATQRVAQRSEAAGSVAGAVTLFKEPGIKRRLDASLLLKRLLVAGANGGEAEAITRPVFGELHAEGVDQLSAAELRDRVARTIGPRRRGGMADRFHAWTEFRRSGLPLLVLIGGCSGSGKSTLAAELSLQLDIGRIQSTDTLREVMRLLVSDHLAPELHRSTYQAWQTLPRLSAGLGGAERVIEGFCAQADKVAVAIRGVVQRSLAEQESAIVEGAHLDPALQEALMQGDVDGKAVVVPLLLAVPDRDELAQHFQWRSVLAPTRSDRRHLEDFESIWQLQEFLLDQAHLHGVAVIPNIGIEFCTHQALELISAAVLERFAPP